MNALDMTLCPLCGQPNNCAMELEKSIGKKQEPIEQEEEEKKG
jgi:hypothetical protein